MTWDPHREDEARWIQAMKQRHARGQEYVCGLADVMRTLEERDELKGRSYTSQGNYIEDAAGDRWWSADLLSRVERERNEARSEVEMLRGDREALNDVYRTMTRILSQKMAVERECDELKTRLAHAEADAEQAVHNEAFNERMKIVAWMRNRVVHKTNASMQTLDELVSICDAIHRGEHE